MPPARRRRERESSDLGARLVVAIPAAVLGGVFIGLGGLSWALFLIALGCVCLYELYRLLERWRPVPAVGFAALAGMVLAARYGGQRDVLEVMVAAFPVLFLATLGRAGRGGATVAVVVASRFQSIWMTTSHALLLGVVVAVVGPLGDLFESLVKRDAGAKDAGSVFGAHGGALDRVDAALFTIVAGYYVSLAVIR